MIRFDRIEEKGNKSPKRKGKLKSKYKREIKVQIEKGNKSPNRIWKVNERIKEKKSFLRPQYEIAVKNNLSNCGSILRFDVIYLCTS